MVRNWSSAYCIAELPRLKFKRRSLSPNRSQTADKGTKDSITYLNDLQATATAEMAQESQECTSNLERLGGSYSDDDAFNNSELLDSLRLSSSRDFSSAPYESSGFVNRQ